MDAMGLSGASGGKESHRLKPFDGLAEEVAGRDKGQLQLVAQPLGLGPFARARGAQQNDPSVHGSVVCGPPICFF
jgi:hypothetical protein